MPYGSSPSPHSSPKNRQNIIQFKKEADMAIKQLETEVRRETMRIYLSLREFTPIWEPDMNNPIDAKWGKPEGGMARANWQANSGMSNESVLATTNWESQEAVVKGKINEWKPSQGPLVFFNNVPYILVLEDGLFPWESTSRGRVKNWHSTQAPHGIVKSVLALYANQNGYVVKGETA